MNLLIFGLGTQELLVVFIIFMAILFFIFKAGTWYGKNKKDK